MARSLLSLDDVTKEEFGTLIERAGELKVKLRNHESVGSLDNRVVGLLFEKPSTRTRTSFEVAADRLGAKAVYMATGDMQLTRGEPVRDTARILGRMLDALVWRGFAQETVAELAAWAGIPVINGLSNSGHPTQVVCDLFTIRETKGRLDGLTLTYLGDANNVCLSLFEGCAVMGLDMRAACPAGHQPADEFMDRVRALAARNANDVTFTVTADPKEAAAGADVLYTDVWVSMGEDDEAEERLDAFRGFQVDEELVSVAAPDVTVMHCLPAHRGLEITDGALEGAHSIVWEQGENKLHGAAAILDWLID